MAIRRRVAVLITIGLLAPAGTAAQLPGTQPPRTSWGDPDLGGVWDFRTITPLERPEELGDQAFLTKEEVAAAEQKAVDRDRYMNEKPAERATKGGNVGAYNWFWMDFGTAAVESGRTSLIVDPPNGRRPPMTPEAAEAWSKRPPWGQEPPPDSYTDMSVFDRCVGSMALPIYPTAYNNYVQVFQTPDHVAMFVEMMGSVRIIPLDGRPHAGVPQALGNSRGRWEGDTLVVETENFSRGMALIGASRNAHSLVERFTRVGPGSIEYEFTVVDPTVWTKPWTAVQTLRTAAGAVYEYACHEGNYALPNILAGARAAEAQPAAER